jgi:hypothetical protein
MNETEIKKYKVFVRIIVLKSLKDILSLHSIYKIINMNLILIKILNLTIEM